MHEVSQGLQHLRIENLKRLLPGASDDSVGPPPDYGAADLDDRPDGSPTPPAVAPELVDDIEVSQIQPASDADSKTWSTISRSQSFVATRYGESYNGSPLGCGGGAYSSADPSILAAPPALYAAWPCGTRLRVTNPAAGRSIIVIRRDACPGCGSYHVDLSEAGMAALAGQDYLDGLVIEVLR